MSVRLDIGTHLRIDAVLSDGERRALLGAVEELRQCFAATSGDAFPIEVHFHSALSAIKVDSGLVLIVTSLLLELTEPEEPLAAIEARLRTAFSALIREGGPALFLCTVFRRIEPDTKAKDPVGAVARMERIRSLNLLAAELSHDFDINIIDLDRSFAHIGGRSLGTDFNLRGDAAVFAAKHVITTTLFAAGLDDFYPRELQDAAKTIYEQRRNSLAPPKLALSASTLHYSQINEGTRLQIFVTNLAAPRRLGDLWLNLKEGRATARESLLAILRTVRRRLRQRLNRIVF
jgi:hypothetical protein